MPTNEIFVEEKHVAAGFKMTDGVIVMSSPLALRYDPRAGDQVFAYMCPDDDAHPYWLRIQEAGIKMTYVRGVDIDQWQTVPGKRPVIRANSVGRWASIDNMPMQLAARIMTRN